MSKAGFSGFWASWSITQIDWLLLMFLVQAEPHECEHKSLGQFVAKCVEVDKFLKKADSALTTVNALTKNVTKHATPSSADSSGNHMVSSDPMLRHPSFLPSHRTWHDLPLGYRDLRPLDSVLSAYHCAIGACFKCGKPDHALNPRESGKCMLASWNIADITTALRSRPGGIAPYPSGAVAETAANTRDKHAAPRLSLATSAVAEEQDLQEE